MSLFKYTLTLLCIAGLGFASWHHFIVNPEYKEYNSQIRYEKLPELPIESDPEPVQEKEPDPAPEPIQEVKNEIPLPERNPFPRIVTKLSSSSKNPIKLTSKRNYITSDNITYIIPSHMRRLKLKIQESNGRTASEYTLPNFAISVAPRQRINIEVIK